MKAPFFCSILLIGLNLFSLSGQGLSGEKPIKKTPKTEISIGQLDPEMLLAVGTVDSTGLWVNAKELTIEGMGWSGNGVIDDYTRLPQIHKDSVTDNVWRLSRHSAGIHVRFIVTGTKNVKAKWTLRGNAGMAHMTLQAVSGVDLYVKSSGKWVFAGAGRPKASGLEHEYVLNTNLNKSESYECMLYLPLYNGVSSVQLGFDKEANVSPAPSLPVKPMVFYGTSIMHGCSASRSGMSFSSMLGRKYNAPVVNLGFSGNGFTEPYFGKIMSEIEASVYFIDCLPNMGSFSTEEVTNRTLALVRRIRSKHPHTPVVLVEDRTHTKFTSQSVTVKKGRVGLRAAYDILKQETQNLYYVEGENLLGNNNEATVDGSHPSDLGMYYYFKTLDPVVNQFLQPSN